MGTFLAWIMALCSLGAGVSLRAAQPSIEVCENSAGATVPDIEGISFGKYDALVFGEMHGTNEAPLEYYKFIKQYWARLRPHFVVGIELPPDVITEFEAAYRKSGNMRDIQDVLGKSNYWLESKDGRTSVAYACLIANLLALKQVAHFELVGFDLRGASDGGFGHLASEYLVKKVQAKTGRGGGVEIIILTGRRHADFDSDENSISRALFNYGQSVLAINLAQSAGSAWVCRNGTCGSVSLDSTERCATNRDLVHLRPRQDEMEVCLETVTQSQPLISE